MSDLWTKKTFLFLMNLDFYQSTFDCIRVNLISKADNQAASFCLWGQINHSCAESLDGVRKIRPASRYLSSLKKRRQKNDAGADLIPINPAAARRCHGRFQSDAAKTHRLLAPRLRSLRVGGLTSGDDADVSLVHAGVFILFPRIESGRVRGGQAGSSCCSLRFGGRGKRKRSDREMRTKDISTGSGTFFFPR